jgi:uncharacterized protein
MTRPRTALVVIGGDDVHEDLFTAALKLPELLAGLGFAARAAMGTARLAAGPDGQAPDLFVTYTAMGEFPPARQAALTAAVRAGSGLLALHSANVFPARDGRLDPDYQAAFELIGSRYVSHGPRPHESRFTVAPVPGHPVTSGAAPFEIGHEHYHVQTAPDAQVLAWRAVPAGPAGPPGREPVLHARREGAGRVCYLQLGHDMRAWDDTGVRRLIANAAAWAARSPALEVPA